MTNTVVTLPKRHYVDRRADRLVEEGRGNPDDLLTTREVADWLQVSTAWLEIGRSKGWGPKFARLNPKRVRYRRADVTAWLEERTHQSVAEYRGI